MCVSGRALRIQRRLQIALVADYTCDRAPDPTRRGGTSDFGPAVGTGVVNERRSLPRSDFEILISGQAHPRARRDRVVPKPDRECAAVHHQRCLAVRACRHRRRGRENHSGAGTHRQCRASAAVNYRRRGNVLRQAGRECDRSGELIVSQKGVVQRQVRYLGRVHAPDLVRSNLQLRETRSGRACPPRRFAAIPHQRLPIHTPSR